MYLDYEKYKELGGNLSNSLFDRFIFRATKEIDNVTQGKCQKLEQIPQEVECCAFELVLYFAKHITDGAVSSISSFGNDGYSVSYAENKTAEQQIYDIIYTYLSDTGLMYCGV